MKSFWEKPGDNLASPAGWTIAFGIILIVAGCAFLVPAVNWGVIAIILALAPVYLVIGIGAWQEKRWAVVTGFWFFAIAAALRIPVLFLNFSWGRLGSVLVFLWLAIEYRGVLKTWKRRQSESFRESDDDDDEEDRPLISFALLERNPRYLDDKILAKIIEEAWGGDYSSGDEEDQDGFVVGESPAFIVKTPVGIFMIHNFPDPYFDEVESVAEEIGELRLRRAVLDHRAWIAVDLLSRHDESEPRESFYPEIVRLILELADEESTLAILRPDTGQINLWNDEVFETLIRPEGENKFNHVLAEAPVLRIEDDDALMLKAVDEAKRRWPDFVEAFHRREKSDHFAVKAPITVGETTEYIWIEVTGFDSEFVCGVLGNEPVALGDLHLGSTVEAPLSDLNDWSYMLGDEKPAGLFTVKAIEAAQVRERTNPDQ